MPSVPALAGYRASYSNGYIWCGGIETHGWLRIQSISKRHVEKREKKQGTKETKKPKAIVNTCDVRKLEEDNKGPRRRRIQ